MQSPQGHDSGFIRTFSGIHFYPLVPRIEDICIVDIAHSLSGIARFNAHSIRTISVAEHSIRVASLLPWRLRRAGRLHDAPEAYMGDMVRPVKYLEQLEAFRDAEDVLQNMIYVKYQCVPDAADLELIKRADDAVLGLEAYWGMGARVGDCDPWMTYCLDLAQEHFGDLGSCSFMAEEHTRTYWKETFLSYFVLRCGGRIE
jgi:hypothetical protein